MSICRGPASEPPEAIALDELRVERWRAKEADGHYMRPLLHVYFIWDPSFIVALQVNHSNRRQSLQLIGPEMH